VTADEKPGGGTASRDSEGSAFAKGLVRPLTRDQVLDAIKGNDPRLTLGDLTDAAERGLVTSDEVKAIVPDYSKLIGLDATTLLATQNLARTFAASLAPLQNRMADIAAAATASLARLQTFEMPSIREPTVPMTIIERPEVWAIRAVRGEIQALAEIMTESVAQTKGQAEIAGAMLAGIQEISARNVELVEKNEELLEESQALRSTMKDGQRSSDRLGGRVLWLTVVLSILAVPVAVDAAINVARAFGWVHN
jgi:hypothetical protein